MLFNLCHFIAAKTSSSPSYSSLLSAKHSSCPVESSLLISMLGRLKCNTVLFCQDYMMMIMTMLPSQHNGCTDILRGDQHHLQKGLLHLKLQCRWWHCWWWQWQYVLNSNLKMLIIMKKMLMMDMMLINAMMVVLLVSMTLIMILTTVKMMMIMWKLWLWFVWWFWRWRWRCWWRWRWWWQKLWPTTFGPCSPTFSLLTLA